MEQNTDVWQVNVFDARDYGTWEISVVRKSNVHGQQSYGWYGNNKIFVGHSDLSRTYVCGFVWASLLKVADELCHRLNNNISID